MNKILYSLIFLALTTSNGLAADNLKIGVVSVEKVLGKAPQVEAINAAMLKRFGGRKDELKALEKEIKDKQENYQRNELVMTEDKLNTLKNTILDRIKSFKKKEAALGQEVSTMRNQEFSVLQQSIRSIIDDVAKEGNYDLILSDGVVYADKSIDISDKILDKMKQAYKKAK